MSRPNGGDRRMVRGEAFASLVQASANAIPGGNEVRVTCRGQGFRCSADWTLRYFVKFMCEWAKDRPSMIPTLTEIETWCYLAQDEARHAPVGIDIPTAPAKLPLRINMALTGGTYHEKWHYLYSKRGNLNAKAMYDMIVPRWALIQDWSGYAAMLLELSNLFEDTRIERNGCREFPGTPSKLADLADYILDLESDSRAQAAAQGGDIANSRSIITCSLRDLGLGYVTDKTRAALATYRQLNNAAVELIVSGPLRSILDRSRAVGINNSQGDDLECLALAMDTIVVLKEQGQDSNQPGDQGDPDGKPDGDGEGNSKLACPKCGAGKKKLRMHKHPSDPTKAVITCTACGHQETVDLQDQPGGGQGQGESLQMEGRDPEDREEQQGGSGEGEPSEGESQDSQGQGDAGQKGNDPGEGESGDGSSDESDQEGDSDSDTGNGPGTETTPGPEGGGGYHDSKPVDRSEYKEAAESILDGAAQESGVKPGTEALGDDIAVANDKAEGNNNLQEGEKPYRPYDVGLDEVLVGEPSSEGIDADRRTANEITKEVRSAIHYLRARLRAVVQAQEMTEVTHGLPKGRGISEVMLVETCIDMMAGAEPKRAYYEEDTARDTSTAVAIVLDESSSMNSMHGTARACLMALADPLDALGCKVQCAGFRNGQPLGNVPNEEDLTRYHRTRGVIHDVFKQYDERMSSVKWRFANTRATGSTPMADGIQYAMDSLSVRPEGHRILFVITDGAPDRKHRPVIQRQIRLCKEAGVHLVGVGIGCGADYVQNLFPDHVYSDDLASMPRQLVSKLNELFDPSCKKRGRRIKKSA